MFGYIMPLKAELKVKEYAKFQCYYCGVCKALGQHFNQVCRFSLNYDVTFLSLLFSSLSEKDERIVLERCIVNPLKKRPVIRNNNAVQYAVYVNIGLIYHKLLDNWKDERNALSYIAALFLKSSFKKGYKNYPELYQTVAAQLKCLHQQEVQHVSSMDKAAHPFAELMSQVTQHHALDASTNRTLKWMGYNLGKWIYILDAYQDITKDKKNKSYNVLIERCGANRSHEEIRKESKEEVEFVLKTCLSEVGKSFELLKIQKNHAILHNIIYLGLHNMMQKILSDRREESNGSIQSIGS